MECGDAGSIRGHAGDHEVRRVAHRVRARSAPADQGRRHGGGQLLLEVLFGAATLRERRAEFEADLRRLLVDHSPSGYFWEWPGDTELVMATKR